MEERMITAYSITQRFLQTLEHLMLHLNVDTSATFAIM